jgi:hypothetical protein
MPNWCENGLTVEGDDHEELMRFKEHAKGKGWSGKKDTILDWNQFLPMPQEVVENGYNGEGKLKGVPSGFHWEGENWGTKWGACETHLHEGTGYLEYSYETAWSAGEGWFVAMAKMFPKLNFSLCYSELGMGFRGTMLAENGIVVDNESEDIPIEEYHDMGLHDDPVDGCPGCEEHFPDADTLARKEISHEWDVSS